MAKLRCYQGLGRQMEGSIRAHIEYVVSTFLIEGYSVDVAVNHSNVITLESINAHGE
jgi:hypothetical protein